MTTPDIAVVGGGPVGAAITAALVAAGFSVTLIERGAVPPPFDPEVHDARVYALAPHSQRWLTSLDVWSTLAGTRLSPYRRMQVWVDDPGASLCFGAADLGAEALGWIVEHAALAPALWAQLGDAEVITDTGLASAVFDEGDRPRLQLSDDRVLTPRLVIAADGVESPLRRLAGIDVDGVTYPQHAVVCHVATKSPHDGVARQRFLPDGPLAFLPLADGRSAIVWSQAGDAARALASVDDATFCTRLEAAAGGVVGGVSAPSARVAVPLRRLHARRYDAPGLVLLGDAAHAVHPLAGQGLNLGFADAEALVRTLVAARDAGRDWSAARTLQRYARARQGANSEMIALTDTLFRLFDAAPPGLRGLLSVGMDGVGSLAPLRRWLARQATGA